MATGETRIDEIVDGIYRISTWQEPYGITFNQFLIADERPALVHTGMHHLFEPVRKAGDCHPESTRVLFCTRRLDS